MSKDTENIESQAGSLSEQEVRHLLELARLGGNPDLIDGYRRQINAMLDFLEPLRAVDVEGVAPTVHILSKATPLRADEAQESLSPDEAMVNAPMRVGEGFAVPRVVE